MTEFPRFKCRFIKSPRLHLSGGPFRRIHVIGRTGQARAIEISENMHRMHDLRILHSLFPDGGIDIGEPKVLCE